MLLHDSRRRTRVDADGAWCRSTSRTVASGTAAGSPAGWSGCAGRRSDGTVSAAGGDRGAARDGASWEQTDWAPICAAYDRLLEITDSPVARANRALAIGFRDGFADGSCRARRGRRRSAAGAVKTVPSIRADLLRRAGRTDEALTWYRTALEANGSEPAREFLRRRIAECSACSARVQSHRERVQPRRSVERDVQDRPRSSPAPGPSKCHHSPEYTVEPAGAHPVAQPRPVGLLLRRRRRRWRKPLRAA